MVILVLACLVIIAVAGLFVVRREWDVTAVLTVFLVTLMAVNARWIVPGAGAIGTPAMVVAFLTAWWWWMARMIPSSDMDRGPSPIRVALFGYMWYLALSWALARLGPLTEIEVNGSNTALLLAFGMTGVALLIMDGVSDRSRLETLLRRTVWGGAAFSVVGILQFGLGLDLVALVSFPGLVRNDDAVQAIALRSGLLRAEGTALHSIEFGVVLAMLLPLALYFATRVSDRRTRRQFAVMSAIIAAGIPLSVSRSGLLAGAAALLVGSIAWTWRERFVGFVAAAGGMIAMGIVVPGLIGTFRALIFGASQDTSITARLERIPLVEERFSQAPWFGSGIGTFSPVEDFLLDNQYFGTLLDTGLIGLVVVFALIAVAILCCLRVLRSSPDEDTRYLASAIMGGIVVLPISMATFDAFFYRIFMGLAFLLIGAAGALWRMVVRGPDEPADHEMALST
jgi:polysaccharide biosynthesis protein PslJ